MWIFIAILLGMLVFFICRITLTKEEKDDLIGMQDGDKKSEQSKTDLITDGLPVQLKAYKRLSTEEKMMIPQWYLVVQDCAHILDSTKDVEVFNERYELLTKNMESIAVLEPRVQFASGMTIKERLDLVRDNRQDLLSAVVIRAYNDAYKKASKLKTEKGKTNAINRFFDNLPRTESVSQIVDQIHKQIDSDGISALCSKNNNINLTDICNFSLVYYKNGHIYDFIPRFEDDLYSQRNRELYYNAIHIVVDGIEVDLSNAESIACMPVPKFFDGELTTNLAYQIRMYAIRATDLKIAKVLIPKAAELMAASGIKWNVKDYRRLVEQLWYLGLVDEGDDLSKKYACSSLSVADIHTAEAKTRFNETLKLCRELGTDLVEMSFHGETCSECSKYEGRVFSLSGANNNYPKLPESVYIYGGIHEGCRHIFSPYIEGSTLVCGAKDAIAFSNRPLVDERTEEQKASYKDYLDKSSSDDRIWMLTSEYYHKRRDDENSVPKTLREYLKIFT